MKIERTSGKPWRQVGPYSKRLQRGAVGDLFDGRSIEGRYIRHLEKELIAHVGGSPSITQKLLIQRIIQLRMRLDAFDSKLTNEPAKWTAHDDRTYGGCQSAYRLSLRELGYKPAPPPELTFQEMMRRRSNGEAAE